MEKKKLNLNIHRNAVSRAIFQVLADRQRSSKITNIPVFKQQVKAKLGSGKVNTADFVAVIQELDDLGVIQILYSEGGSMIAFKWRVSPTELAVYLSEELARTAKPMVKVRKDEPTTQPEPKTDTIEDSTMLFELENGRQFKIKYPNKLSQKDKERIVEVVQKELT